MNKNELISSIAKNAKISKREAGDALEAFIDSVSDAMKKGQRVALVGFGTFSSAARKARRGINPKTRQVIKIAAKKVPRFKPGKELKKIVAKAR